MKIPINVAGWSGVLALGLMCAPVQAQDKKITQAEALQAVLSKVQPDYPPIAQKLRIFGSVDLEATVAENGAVEKVDIVSGNPVLTKPAADALRKWKFKPFQDGGKPIRVVVPVSISFKHP